MATYHALWQRFARRASQYIDLMKSAKTTGLSASDVREALDAPPAAFSHELAEAWQVCDSLVRQLGETLIAARDAGVFETNVQFRSPQHMREFRELKQEEAFEWLQRNEYYEEVADLTEKMVCHGVAFDLVEFANEALRCTIRGPLTVASRDF